MKKLSKLAITLSIVVIITGMIFLLSDENKNTTFVPSVSAAEIVQSGSCGTNVTYTLDSEGTITISGSGEMSDYSFSTAPWSSSKGSIKKVIISDGITSIGRYAFDNCSYLQSVTIPDSLTRMGTFAFYNCNRLQSVYINDLAKWIAIDFAHEANPLCNSADLYLNGEKATDITIPDSVTKIGFGVFYGCSSLQSVTIGDSVTSIENYAFRLCSLQSVVIDNSVTSIGQYAFDYSNLQSVIFNGSSEQWENISIGGWNSSLTSAKRYCLDDGYTTDGKSILNQSKTLLVHHFSHEKIYTIPSGIKSIEQNAFSDNKNLSAVILPDGIRNIGSYAFYSSNLSSIYIPASVSTIDQYAFSECGKLSDVYFGGTAEQFYVISKGSNNSYLNNATIHYNTRLIEVDGAVYTEDMKTLVAISNKISGAYTIPLAVTTIKSYAFSDCEKITQVSIPESVIAIEKNAFRNCDGISGITLPYGITKLNDYTFYDCDKLQSITIPDNVATIGGYVFYSCENLKTISFSSGLISVGNYAFYDCKVLEKLSLPESLTTIGDYSFSGCTKLSEIFFPSSLDTIGKYAFSENSALTYISLPDSVNSLGVNVFYNCNNLEKVGLPEGTLTTIPANAFKGCSKLTSIYIPENITSFGDSAFFCCDNLSDIYYNGIENEWDNISIVSSNSVIWAANVHFEHAHTNNTWQAIIEPGTNIIWLKASICDVCGFEKRAELETTHIGYSVEAVLPTCLAVGYTAGVYCTECEDYISGHEEIEALGHDEVKHNAQAPTCSEIGWDAYATCSRCDYSTYVEKAIDSSAHKWDNGTITTTATCMVNGVKTYTCQHNASHKKTEKLGVNASNHINTKNVAEVKASCTSVGYTAGVYCNDCQKYISGHKEISALGHSYKDTVTAPTCTKEGYTTHTCTRCNDTYTDSKVKALGHSYKDTVTAPTCTKEGYTTHTCTRCNNTYTDSKVKALGHSYKDTVTAPTCTKEGYTTHTCTRCNDTYTDSKVKALGHSYKNTVTAPTCTKEGYTTHTCTRCNNTYTDTKVNATGHKWGEWKETLAPTATANGKEERSCTLCKITESRATDKLSFNIGDLDENGKITAADARIALRASVGLETLSETQRLSADVDNNSKITAADARLILRASVGLEKLDAIKKD